MGQYTEPRDVEPSGRFTITFELEKRKAAELLGRLSHDDAFRQAIVANQDDALAELASSYGITIEVPEDGDPSLIGEDTEGNIELPKKRHLSDVTRAIQFPKSDPGHGLSWCKVWALVGVCAGASDWEPPPEY